MNTVKKLTGTAIAAAAAALLTTGFTASAVASPEEGTVKCSGINSCKGSTACATATNSCKGQNSCKGKGWIKASQEQCTEKGGTVLK